jgi:prepilin-type N-terminal cleavage/methylation domain-containing protein
MLPSISTRPERRAFTLVELLVVIGVVAVLVMLLLPAISAARESARRAQCQNNVRQMVLAVQNYHAANRRFPPGRFLGTYGEGADSRAWSWMALVLPFAEMQNLHVEGQVPRSNLRDSGIAHRAVSLFLCPTAPGNLAQPREDAGNLIGFAVGNTTYKGVSGANWGADTAQKLEQVGQWRNASVRGSFDGLADGDGILWRNDSSKRLQTKHVNDGLDHTFLVGEDLPQHNIWCSWPYTNNAYGTCAIPPNNVPADRTWQYDSYSFRSAHPGGLNFGMAGGAVKFIPDDIDLAVYRALATRAGGEAKPSLSDL